MHTSENKTKDDGLIGNEKIEEAIVTLQQKPSEELLAQSENMTNLVKQFKLIDEEKIQARKKEVKHAGI